MMSDTRRDGLPVELAIVRRRFLWTLIVFCCIPLSLGILTVIDWNNDGLQRWALLAVSIATVVMIPVLIVGLRRRLAIMTDDPPSAPVIALIQKFAFWMPLAFATSFAVVGTFVVSVNFDVPPPLVVIIFVVASATGLVSYVRIMTISGYLQDAARSEKP